VLYERLKVTELPVEIGTGGRTKWSRVRRELPKTRLPDAARLGASNPAVLHIQQALCVSLTATGWQCRQMCLMDKRSFPRTKERQRSRVRGFQTGDLVRAVVPTGIRVGTYVGRVAVRATGSFNVTVRTGTIQGISAKYCRTTHHQDSYSYTKGGAASSRSPEWDGSPSPVSL
jgi:hypothetical protein